MTKKFYFAFWDSIIFCMIWVFIIVFSVSIVNENYLYIVFCIPGSLYAVPKSIQWLLFLLDMKHGAETKTTIFMGFLSNEKLDVFYKIKYSNIYFEDDVLSKNYLVFSDVEHEDIRRGDPIMISYYSNTRIVVEIAKIKELSI